MNKWIVIVFVWAGSLLTLAQAQQNPLDKLVNNFETAWKTGLREKIYVHTDRQAYLSGEVLWFKIYVTDGSDGHLLNLSKIAYVELLDKENKPVLQAKVSLSGGMGDGSLLLSTSIPTGQYRFRIYTRWMRNNSPEEYFSKTISLINTHQTLDTSFIHRQQGYRASFYPEGGDLVNGLTSVVAVKASNAYGGIGFEGVLLDDDQDTLLHFKPLVFGMGKFSFKPQRGHQYKAIFHFPNGDSLVRELPDALPEGYVMKLQNSSPGNLRLDVAVSGLRNINSGSKVFVIIHHQLKVVYAGEMELSNGQAAVEIKQSGLPEGISTVTVFDEKIQPVCERLCFKRPEGGMNIRAEDIPAQVKARSKVDIPIETLSKEKAVKGHLSAAVYLLDSLNQANPENIFDYWWLTSDLNGRVEHPEFYFDSANPMTDEALENLMLVDGWRKFQSDAIKNTDKPLVRFVPEGRGHIITGQILNAQTRKPAVGIPVYLSVPGQRVQLHVNKSDSLGRVHFEMPDFYDDKSIVLQTKGEQPGQYELNLFSPFSEKYKLEKMPDLYLDSDWNSSLGEKYKQMVISQTFQPDTGQQFYTPDIDSLPFYGKAEVTYLLDDYRRFTTMEEVLREYVKEVNVIVRKKNYSLRALNAASYRLKMLQGNGVYMFENNPLVLLDGIPVFDMNKIMAYDPLKVEKLEIVPEGFHLGPVFYEGILSFTTYTGRPEGYTFNPDDLILDYEGLQRKRIFKAPQYANTAERDSHLPDYRNLLCWKPELKSDKNGRTNLSFYTGDVQGKFLIVIQGVSADGEMGYFTKSFWVKHSNP